MGTDPASRQQAMEKIRALEIELEQLKFLNQEEQATIDKLSKLISEAIEHVWENDGWFSSTKEGTEWVRKAKEAVYGR